MGEKKTREDDESRWTNENDEVFVEHRRSIVPSHLNKECSNTFPWQVRPKDADGREDFEVGQTLIRRKGGVWGKIFLSKQEASKEGGDAIRTLYGVSSNVDALRRGRRIAGSRVAYYTREEIESRFCFPPVRFPIHPDAKGQHVAVYSIPPAHKLYVPDGTRGVVKEVIRNPHGTMVTCTMSVSDSASPTGYRLVDLHLRRTRFLRLDNDLYLNQNVSEVWSTEDQGERVVYEFKDVSFPEIKALFEMAEGSTLRYTSSKGGY